MTSQPKHRQRTSMKDVAQRAGVSLSSVSRVLDNHPDVSVVMRNRVLDAVASLGYTPDPLARSLRTGSTHTVGFVAGDTGNPLIAKIGAAAQLALLEAGYSLLVANSQNDPVQELKNIQLLDNRKVDGFLLSLADETVNSVSDYLAKVNSPIVLIDRELNDVMTSAVHSNHRIGITKATSHLVSLGHKRVGLINGNPHVRPSRERRNALEKALSGVGESSVVVSDGDFSEEHGFTTTIKLMQSSNRPTALIAGSNQILIGVLRALRLLNLKFPEDLSLITCDDTPISELYEPPIATISRDPSLIGKTAGKLFIDELNGARPVVITLETLFNPAHSCGQSIGGSQ